MGVVVAKGLNLHEDNRGFINLVLPDLEVRYRLHLGILRWSVTHASTELIENLVRTEAFRRRKAQRFVEAKQKKATFSIREGGNRFPDVLRQTAASRLNLNLVIVLTLPTQPRDDLGDSLLSHRLSVGHLTVTYP